MLSVVSDTQKPCLVTARCELEGYSRTVEDLLHAALLTTLTTTPDSRLEPSIPEFSSRSLPHASLFYTDNFIYVPTNESFIPSENYRFVHR